MIERVLTAVRYVQPFRQGGSVPALVEADDGALYVLKFYAAAQGRRALMAELIAGEIGRRLGLRVPELAIINVTPNFGMGEAHPEIRDTLNASAGLNLGLRFLPDSLEYNPLLKPPPPPDEAAAIVWFRRPSRRWRTTSRTGRSHLLMAASFRFTGASAPPDAARSSR